MADQALKAPFDQHALFNELVAKETEKYYRTVYRIVRSPEDAREIVQEGFTKAFQRFSQFEGQAQFSSWVYRIMVNEALQKLRSKKVRKEEVMDPFLPRFILGHHAEKIANWRELPYERLERKEFREYLIQCLDQLSEEYQVPYILKDFEGFSEKEIAQELNISLSTVKNRLHQTRLYLRKKIELFLTR